MEPVKLAATKIMRTIARWETDGNCLNQSEIEGIIREALNSLKIGDCGEAAEQEQNKAGMAIKSQVDNSSALSLNSRQNKKEEK